MTTVCNGIATGFLLVSLTCVVFYPMDIKFQFAFYWVAMSMAVNLLVLAWRVAP